MANNALAPNIDNVLSDYVYAGRKLREQRNKNMLNPQVSLSDRLESLSYAAGEGFADQLRGLQQLITHPIQSVQDIYSGVKYAVQNPREAAQAAVEGLKGAVQSPESATRFIAQNFSPTELATGLGKLGTMREIVVHHGTPHRFEPTEANPLGEFNASKIGTGEGAQAYGHGVYLAESPKVAKGYATDIPYRNFVRKIAEVYNEFDSPVDAEDALKEAGLTSNQMRVMQALKEDDYLGFDYPHQALEAALKHPEHYDLSPKTKEALSEISTLYKADLPDEMVDRMLDWDKPLSEQPKNVQSVLKDMLIKANKSFPQIDVNGNPTAGQIHHLYSQHSGGKVNVSNELQQHGIPGIKYLDAGSRGQAGTGTRNFVVFPGEEKKVKILERK